MQQPSNSQTVWSIRPSLGVMENPPLEEWFIVAILSSPFLAMSRPVSAPGEAGATAEEIAAAEEVTEPNPQGDEQERHAERQAHDLRHHRRQEGDERRIEEGRAEQGRPERPRQGAQPQRAGEAEG